MSLSSPFIKRPVGTALLTIAIALAGILAYFYLPVAPLPEVDFPTISVSASLPGASPETMASSVATPLERQFGRIAGVTEMTSSSNLGSTSITLQFDLNRDINAAARDVQAAINAAQGQLPANLPSRPHWRKYNPADAPILILSVTSDIYNKPQIYDAVSSILGQKLSQVEGVGQVGFGGGANPAVRVELNPRRLNNLGLSLEDVRTMLGSVNANRPKGSVSDENRTFSLETTDQLLKASDYRPLVLTYKNGAAVRLSSVADVVDSVEDVRTTGLVNGKPAVLVFIFREPGANIIDTVDRVMAAIPQIQASIPAGMDIGVAVDRTTSIRASVNDVELTLLLAIALVVLVVFFFLRDWRTTLIPSVAVPVSLVGTFGVMYLMGYTIDNLSLMAMTIATGFVVDDAIVVIENITRHLEAGLTPLDAAMRGAAEIGFTVLSISISLIAVFLPILLMAGIVGRLFREFAVTLSVAIAISLVISLTTTPMMCAAMLRQHAEGGHGWIYRTAGRFDDFIMGCYEWALRRVLKHPLFMLMVTVATVAITAGLYVIVPKTLFPNQDIGRMAGVIEADQDTSYAVMRDLVTKFANVVYHEPSVLTVAAFSGGGGTVNTARMFVTLKPLNERTESTDQVMARLRGQLAHIPGASLFLQPIQDIKIGGRATSAQYQYTLQGDNLADITAWAPRMLERMRSLPGIVDLTSDQKDRGLEASLVIDRATASRLGVSASAIDATLYDAFGQRQVSTMYFPLNQYHVVMEVADQFRNNPDSLKYIYVKSTSGALIPLSAFTHYEASTTPLTVNHSGQFPSITISFNLLPNVSLSQAVTEIQDASRSMGMPETVHGSFSGTAQAFQASLSNELLLVIAALATVYIVLGILYESFIHPITILSTLPSASVGALLALLITRTELSIIAFIGIILLIGIVKKNAIMMIDFALEAERREHLTPKEAIFKACLLRFRPITMTTMAALLGGLPLALGTGMGAELRRPLGITIVGGLIFSQLLTLFTTPVIYLYLDRFRLWSKMLLTGHTDDPMLEAAPL